MPVFVLASHKKVNGGGMTNVVQQRPAPRPAEAAAIAGVVDRLAQRFPAHPREAVARCVQERYESFAGSRIRDFVPVLVERAAGRELSALTPRS